MAEIVFPLTLSGPVITPDGYPLEDVNEIALSLGVLLSRRVEERLIANQLEPIPTAYEIRASFPKYGSFEQQLVIFLKDFASNHPLIVAMSALIPSINAVFTLYDNFRKRLPAKPQVEKASQEELIVIGGKELLKVDPSTFKQLVDEPEFREILERLSPERIESLEFSDGQSKIRITGGSDSRATWRAIGKLKKEIEKLKDREMSRGAVSRVDRGAEQVFAKPTEITGTIRAVDLDAKTGRVQVDQGADVPPGEYDFALSPEAKLEDLQNHVGGRVKLSVHSMSFSTPTHRPGLVVSQISRLALARGSSI